MSSPSVSREYVAAALANATQRIANCPTGLGLRNKTLNREVYSLARLIGANLSPEDIMTATIAAATANGYLQEHGQAATVATIEAAIAKGRQSPRTAPLNKYEQKKLAKLAAAPINDRADNESAGCNLEKAILPMRTAPDENGKPYFAANNSDGPPHWQDEVRRHTYRRDGQPVRVKVKRSGGGYTNWYRVRDQGGAIGWQAKEPDGYTPVPYVGAVDPFDPELVNDPIYWTEGEKDTDTLAKLDILAFTFGGCGDGLPAGVEQYLAGRHLVVLADNDEAGRTHAERKAAVADPLAASVRIVHFPNAPEKGDVTDWIESGKTADDLVRLSDDAPLWSAPLPQSHSTTASEPQRIKSAGPELMMVCMADVKLKPIDWLWNKRIALGKVTVLAGDGGLGKSTILCDLAARTSTGENWPDGERNDAAGNVIILAAEDSLDDTIGPRLCAAGADMQRVFSIPSVKNEDQSRRSFNLKADLFRLEQKIAEIGGARLIIIDPISSYLGGVDSHKNAEVRSVLEPMGEMASRLNVAVICNNHFSKGGGGANSRIIGSVAFVNQARSAFIVTQDAEDPERRFFMPSKSNISVLGAGLAYRIGGLFIDCDGVEILTSQICWESTPVNMSADAALAALSEGDEGKTAKSEAAEFLEAVLADGQKAAKEVQAEARAAGISPKALRSAREAMGIKPTKAGFGKGWVWELPKMPKAPKMPEDARPQTWASSAPEGHLRDGGAA